MNKKKRQDAQDKRMALESFELKARCVGTSGTFVFTESFMQVMRAQAYAGNAYCDAEQGLSAAVVATTHSR